MVAGLPSSDKKPAAAVAYAAPAAHRPAAAPAAAAPVPSRPPAAVAPAAMARAPAPAPVAAAPVSALTYAAPSKTAPNQEMSKMYSDTQVFLVEREGDDPGLFSALNICCNLFMGACIGATAVLLAMFFFTDCRFVLSVKNVTRNRSRAALEDWDGGEARRATELEPATSTGTVLALEGTGEALISDGEERASPESTATPGSRALRKAIRTRPATKFASRRTEAVVH
ncbi:uncharacterized protein LOC144123581 [Amblyomma americanum]